MKKAPENDLLIADWQLTVALHLAFAGQELPLNVGFAPGPSCFGGFKTRMDCWVTW